jgi:hypothetical protein
MRATHWERPPGGLGRERRSHSNFLFLFFSIHDWTQFKTDEGFSNERGRVGDISCTYYGGEGFVMGSK